MALCLCALAWRCWLATDCTAAEDVRTIGNAPKLFQDHGYDWIAGPYTPTANVVLWAEDAPPADWTSDEPGAYVDLHQIAGRKERVDQNHVKYFLGLKPGEKRRVTYSVTYQRRKVQPELNQDRRREPL